MCLESPARPYEYMSVPCSPKFGDAENLPRHRTHRRDIIDIETRIDSRGPEQHIIPSIAAIPGILHVRRRWQWTFWGKLKSFVAESSVAAFFITSTYVRDESLVEIQKRSPVLHKWQSRNVVLNYRICEIGVVH